MMDLFKAIGLGLVVILPLANPLTTVALFLGLAGNMNNAERNRQSLMASVYVFAILMVAWYAGQVVMNTFGISIPGLRIAGGLIVAFIWILRTCVWNRPFACSTSASPLTPYL